jgi:sulfate adenylyltransferase (ADP) / ATP adenylyltransferase
LTPHANRIILNLFSELRLNALAKGSLAPFLVNWYLINEAETEFVISVNQNLGNKPYNRGNSTSKSPFLPPFEEGLLVESIKISSDSHRLLLNKFPVLDIHLLITSKDFRNQHGPFTVEDISVSLETLEIVGTDGLAFYNHGANSGYSQEHFHMQVVNLEKFPLKPVYINGSTESLGFRVEVIHELRKKTAQEILLEIESILKKLDLSWNHDQSFNFLWTSDFFVVIPRSKSRIQENGLSGNGLCFTGNLYTKTEEEFKILQSFGVLNLLKELGRKN